MNILEAQREMRSAFLGGFAGQLVSGLIWLIAAALGTWVSPGWYGRALFRQHVYFPPYPVRSAAAGTPRQGQSGEQTMGKGFREYAKNYSGTVDQKMRGEDIPMAPELFLPLLHIGMGLLLGPAGLPDEG